MYYVGAGWNRTSGEQLSKLSRYTELIAFLVDDYEVWEVDEELRELYENGTYAIHKIQIERTNRNEKRDMKNKWK